MRLDVHGPLRQLQHPSEGNELLPHRARLSRPRRSARRARSRCPERRCADIDACNAVLDAGERNVCWQDLDKKSMEEIVPWVPYLDATNRDVISEVSRRLRIRPVLGRDGLGAGRRRPVEARLGGKVGTESRPSRGGSPVLESDLAVRRKRESGGSGWAVGDQAPSLGRSRHPGRDADHVHDLLRHAAGQPRSGLPASSRRRS